jgi:hypothetical protein
MSILLTSTSNIMAVFTMPFVVTHLLATTHALSLDAWAMTIRLVKAVLLPLLAGACFRLSQQVRPGASLPRHTMLQPLLTCCGATAGPVSEQNVLACLCICLLATHHLRATTFPFVA